MTTSMDRTTAAPGRLTAIIASPLEAEHATAIAATFFDRVELIYRPDLNPAMRTAITRGPILIAGGVDFSGRWWTCWINNARGYRKSGQPRTAADGVSDRYGTRGCGIVPRCAPQETGNSQSLRPDEQIARPLFFST